MLGSTEHIVCEPISYLTYYFKGDGINLDGFLDEVLDSDLFLPKFLLFPVHSYHHLGSELVSEELFERLIPSALPLSSPCGIARGAGLETMLHWRVAVPEAVIVLHLRPHPEAVPIPRTFAPWRPKWPACL